MANYIFFIFLLFTGYARAADITGLYSISGEHSEKGTYSGQLEIRLQANSEYSAIRVITFDNYEFEGLKVQEVWTGKVVSKSEIPMLQFNLKQADFVVRYKNQNRSEEDFKNRFQIETALKIEEGFAEITFKDKYTGNYSEIITSREDLSQVLLWKDLRQKILGNGAEIPGFMKPLLLLSKHRSEFSDHPFVKKYENRNEYRRGLHFIIFDPTDYEFYQNNPDKLRVVNKVLDEISLVESVNRRNAYANSLDAKAEYFESNLREKHLPSSTGILADAKINAAREFQGYEGDFSAGLWSGLYAGAQAMRYLKTKDPEALETFRKILNGIFILLDITGRKSEFARAVAPLVEAQLAHGWVRGKGAYSHLMYQPEGNNDMIKGVTHAFMWATYVIPESDKETWDLLKQKSLQLLGLSIFKDKIQNMPSAIGLAAIIHKSPFHEKKFRELYKKLKIQMSGYSFDTSFYIEGSADWSGINLRVVGFITNIMIAEKLGATHISKQLRKRLLDAWITYESAKRPLVTVAAYAFANRFGIESSNFKDLSGNKKRFQDALENAMWNLRGIAAPKPNYDLEIDHSMNPEWSLSPMPKLFWKAYASPSPTADYFFQGIFDYPIFEMQSYTSNYLWKDSPFDFNGRGDSRIESSGADYLYLYWMMKYADLDWN